MSSAILSPPSTFVGPGCATRTPGSPAADRCTPFGPAIRASSPTVGLIKVARGGEHRNDRSDNFCPLPPSRTFLLDKLPCACGMCCCDCDEEIREAREAAEWAADWRAA